MSRRRVLLAATFLLPSALLLAASSWVVGRYRIEPPDRLGPEARTAVVAALRAVVEGRKPARPAHPELERALDRRGPVVVNVWRLGKRVARVEGRGERIADAVLDAGGRLVEAMAPEPIEVRATCRIQVDVVSGRGPIALDVPALSLFALSGGLEGLGVETAGDEEHLLLPDELIREKLLHARNPVGFIPDFNLGLNRERADKLLAGTMDKASWKALDKRYFRFKSDSFVEGPDRKGAPLQLTRGTVPGPELGAVALRDAAVAGGRYLVAHLAENGRYIYETNLATGRGTDPRRPRPYSLPRHAGTTYFLAELYRHTGEEFLREPIERAFRHFADLVAEGGCSGTTPSGARFACVHQKEDRYAGLGSTALAVVALVEYRRATGEATYDDMARAMTEWILSMQRPDGSFAHRYDVKAAVVDHETQLLYYSGEAALALARMHAVYGGDRYRDAAERALDWLIGWYDFFAGGFFYGEDHWTCIAAEAAWPALRHDRYREFCDGYGEFLRRQQLAEGDFAEETDDLAGLYGVTPFVVPNNTPVGSRTEAMLSSYLLDRHHGRDNQPLREQILRSMRFALRQQVRPDGDFAWPAAGLPLGAVTASPTSPVVRIDYVQHICSAMIRTAAILDPSISRAAGDED
ncbi:MAG TPA: hypothetical protein VFU21_02695 [Kofleriaceae bacterium]|nr:hypothetical protein [Kofleriaceae bacterium]